MRFAQALSHKCAFVLL